MLASFDRKTFFFFFLLDSKSVVADLNNALKARDVGRDGSLARLEKFLVSSPEGNSVPDLLFKAKSDGSSAANPFPSPVKVCKKCGKDHYEWQCNKL